VPAQHFSSIRKCRQTKILKEYTLSSIDEFDTQEIKDNSQVEKQSWSASF